MATPHFQHRIGLFLLLIAAVPAALLSTELLRWVVADVDYLGRGGVMPAAIRFLWFVTVAGTLLSTVIRWWKETSAVPWGEVLSWAGFLCLFLPVTVLIGKVVSANIPPYEPLIGCILGPLVAIFFAGGVAPSPAGPLRRRGAAEIERRNTDTHPTPRSPDPTRTPSAPGGGGAPAVYRWAGYEIPDSALEGNFCVVGAQGAGKTLLVRDLMQCVVPHIGKGADRRAIVYDVKRDCVSHLLTMGVGLKDIDILNPFDRRGVAWDIAADLTDNATAIEYARIFIPATGKETTPYFGEAAQALLAGAIRALRLACPGEWTLRDLIHVTATPPRLRRLLRQSPYTKDVVDKYFRRPKTLYDVMSTLANAMTPLEAVAAAWERTTDKISFQKWATAESSVIVLGRMYDYERACTSINNVMFRRLSEVLLSRGEFHGDWRTWFFVDELREAGKLNGLTGLLTNGRSKGVRVVLGFQDVEGLRDTYGDHAANELPALCASRSFLRVASAFTAKWASEQIGDVEKFEYTTARSTSQTRRETTHSRNVNEAIVTRPAVLPSEILNYPLSRDGIVHGCHLLPVFGGYEQSSARNALHDPVDAVDFAPRPDQHSIQLTRWGPDDEKRIFRSAADDAASVDRTIAREDKTWRYMQDRAGRATQAGDHAAKPGPSSQLPPATIVAPGPEPGRSKLTGLGRITSARKNGNGVEPGDEDDVGDPDRRRSDP